MTIENERWKLRPDSWKRGYAEIDAIDTREPKPRVGDHDHLAFAQVVWTMEDDILCVVEDDIGPSGSIGEASLRCRERAQIMASGLDLLAALKGLLPCVDQPNSQHREQYQQALAAIAKAEGRS